VIEHSKFTPLMRMLQLQLRWLS